MLYLVRSCQLTSTLRGSVNEVALEGRTVSVDHPTVARLLSFSE